MKNAELVVHWLGTGTISDKLRVDGQNRQIELEDCCIVILIEHWRLHVTSATMMLVQF